MGQRIPRIAEELIERSSASEAPFPYSDELSRASGEVYGTEGLRFES